MTTPAKKTPAKKRTKRVPPRKGRAQTDAPVVRWQAAWMAAYAAGGNITAACRAAGVPRSTYIHAHQDHADFRDRQEAAFEEYLDSIEAEVTRMARAGGAPSQLAAALRILGRKRPDWLPPKPSVVGIDTTPLIFRLDLGTPLLQLEE